MLSVLYALIYGLILLAAVLVILYGLVLAVEFLRRKWHSAKFRISRKGG